MRDTAEKFKQHARRLVDRLPKEHVRKINKLISDKQNFQTIGLWVSALVASSVSILFAYLFKIAEGGFQKLVGHLHFSIFVVSPILFLLSWLIIRRFAPEASGSGIPQIMAANEINYTPENKTIVDRLLSLKTAVVKIISALLCVLGGGAIGREGPTLQISTSIFHFFGKLVRRFSPNISEHTWVVAGAASGLAAAFNTPLGGIVYAIEELGLVHFHKVRTALLSGVIVSGLVAQWVLGNYLYLGFPALEKVDFKIIPAAFANGALTGLLGALFGSLLLFLIKKRRAITKLSYLVLLTLACGSVMAGLSLLNSKAAGSGVDTITGFLFHKDAPSIELVIIRYFGTIISYLSGAAGGIFSPSLAIGASIGSFLAKFIGEHHTNLMVMLGMIGFLTGVTRTPFTAFILVLEMTDRHSAIFPMMVAAMTAQWFARIIDDESFYEHVKHFYTKAEIKK
ncbi:MAG: chloride channel protein [Oligoflexia bacterium]|nr:chloride channel protein [Oligoflexia bacterium]